MILSFAAVLFVDPARGRCSPIRPRDVRFPTPLYPRFAALELTANQIGAQRDMAGRWAVFVYNQKDEVVASYDLLTMNTP